MEDKADFKAKKIIDREVYYIMIKGIKLVTAFKFMKQGNRQIHKYSW